MAECGRVKIADLGVCNEFMGEDASMNNGTIAGTPAFRSPETLLTGQVNIFHLNGILDKMVVVILEYLQMKPIFCFVLTFS